MASAASMRNGTVRQAPFGSVLVGSGCVESGLAPSQPYGPVETTAAALADGELRSIFGVERQRDPSGPRRR